MESFSISMLGRRDGGGDTLRGNTFEASDPPPFDLASVYAGHVDGKRLACAFMTWVAYDFAITAGDSVELFWSYPWSISKTMYLVNRYNTVLTLSALSLRLFLPSPSIRYCNAAPWIELVGSTILIIVVELAMIMRVYALWNRNRWILRAILTLFALHSTSYIAILSYAYAIGFFIPMELPFTGCMIIPGWPLTWVIFVTSIGFETVIISLTVYKSWSVAAQKGMRTPLYSLLLGDGVGYFTIIIAAQILSFVCVMVPSLISYPIVQSYPVVPVIGVSCGRLLTRLQRLLVSKGKGQSGFSTRELWSSNAPEFAFGHDSEAPGSARSSRKRQEPRSRLRTTGGGGQGSSMDLGSDIGMGDITKATVSVREEGYTSQEPAQGHQEVEPADHLTKGTTLEMLSRVPRAVEIQIEIDGDGPRSYAYGSTRSVLDPSTSSAGQPHDGASTGERMGSVIISRMGKYD